jgi:hypothetical protein
MGLVEDVLAKQDALLANIKQNLPELEKLLEEVSGHWAYEDKVYRFYSQSDRTFRIQKMTQQIYSSLEDISPLESKEIPNELFNNIMKLGVTGEEFTLEHNEKWEQTCRPFLEAFFHAKYFLEMAVKYGKKYEKPPKRAHSGWAALLSFYNIW